METTDDNRKTSPLETAAIASYEPSNRELMAELHRQNGIMRGILHQTTKHNGRMSKIEERAAKLEVRVAPIEKVYRRAAWVIGVACVVGPILVQSFSTLLDLWLKIKGGP